MLSVDAAADKTYDLFFYKPNAKGVGSLSQYPAMSNQLLKIEKKEKNPAKAASAKAAAIQAMLDKFKKEEGGKVYQLVRDEEVAKYEAANKEANEQRRKDFLEGKKTNRVFHVNKDDCR